MKMDFKKLLPLVLILFVLFAFLPQAFASDVSNSNSDFSDNDLLIDSQSVLNNCICENANADGLKNNDLLSEESVLNNSNKFSDNDDLNSDVLKSSKDYLNSYVLKSSKDYLNSDVLKSSKDYLNSDVLKSSKDYLNSDVLKSYGNCLVEDSNDDISERVDLRNSKLGANELKSGHVYETLVNTEVHNYTLNLSSDYIEVNITYNSSDSQIIEELSNYTMYAWINGESDSDKCEVWSYDSSRNWFHFNIYGFEDKLNVGINTITFHPDLNERLFKEGIIDVNDCYFATLTVNAIELNNTRYRSIVSPSSINYTANTSSLINVFIETDDFFTQRLSDSDFSVFVYINSENIANRVKIPNVSTNMTRFTFDLALVSDNLSEGINVLTVHPHTGMLEGIGTGDYIYEQLIVNFTSSLVNGTNGSGDNNGSGNTSDNGTGDDNGSSSEFDYETIINPSEVDYTNGTSSTIEVTAIYDDEGAFDMHQYDAMYVYINGNSYNLNSIINAGGYSVDTIHAGDKSFSIDLNILSKYFTNGLNTIVFHPESSLLSQCIPSAKYNFNELKVNFIPSSNGTGEDNGTGNGTGEINGTGEDNGTGNGTGEINGTDDENITAIYVSTDGLDTNDGSIDSPVQSIAQAIELVKITGINNIFILEGNYTEYAIYVDISCNIKGLGIVIIDAEKIDRIFNIYGEIEVKLDNLILVNGFAPVDGYAEDATHGEISEYAAGGAISINEAYVTINNLTFVNNAAEHFGGAVNVEADNFVINNSNFLFNIAEVFAGALDVEGDAPYIENCLFIGNECNNGGAIGSFGYDCVIINSRFENNSAGSIAGAIYVDNMPLASGQTTNNIIENNTFINNYATEQGGAINVENYGSFDYGWDYTIIRNNTFINNSAYNGGAISAYYGDTASIENIFINNTAGYGGAIASISTSYSLMGLGKLFLRGNTILNCSAEENGDAIFNLGYIDSKLNFVFIDGATVKSNGEAVILNVSVSDDVGNPISGSPVNFTVGGEATINEASDLIEGIGTVRFVPRENGTFIVSGIYDNKWDMDNYHNVINGTVIVENATADYFGIIYLSKDGNDDNIGDIDNPVNTFKQAFLLANRDGGSREIIIYEGTYAASGYVLNKTFKITGIGNVTLDGQNLNGIFKVNGEYDNNFTFTGLNFINGVSSRSDAGFYRGGAIFFMGGNLYLENDTFKSNSAIDGGGALYVNKGFDYNYGAYPAYAYIKNCLFENNYGTEDGGAIALYDCDVEVINSTFNNNNAKAGGAIAIGGRFGGAGNLTVINCSFNKNTASYEGGAILGEALNSYNTRYFLLVNNSNFTENSAVYGGAIYGSDANVTYSIFINNKANNQGGAIEFTDDESFVENSIFSNNNANNGTQYCGNSILINKNFWGLNYDTIDDLIENNVIYINTDDDLLNSSSKLANGSVINLSWANVKIEGPTIVNAGEYDYDIKFISNNKSDLDYILPDHIVSVSNRDSNNKLNASSIVLSNNKASISYSAIKNARDVISVDNINMYYDSLITSLDVLVRGIDDGNSSDENGTLPDNSSGDNGTVPGNGTGANGTEDNSTGNITNETVPGNGTGDNSTGNMTNDTGVFNSKDLQEIIDNTPAGATLDLRNKVFENVSNITLSKDINIVGGIISSDNSSSPIFIILPKSQNGPESVNISGMDANLNDGDVFVNVIAENDTNPLVIDVPEINLEYNKISASGDDSIPELITVLEIDSDRAILSPSNPIKVRGNTIDSGIKPFEFIIGSVLNGSDVNIPVNDIVPSKEASIIHYNDMNTTSVNVNIEGRVGKYFEVNLTDKDGKALANKLVQIGFNGKIYNRTSNETGGVRLQINLAAKGTYTFAISFLGDESYNASFVVSKIVVSAQKTKLTSSNKSFKASAKTKTLTATLKSSVYNKVIGNKKVTFTVNGKTYTATTNSKGVASVKVSLSSKKTYSFTAKFAGDNMYASSSVSGKVTIK